MDLSNFLRQTINILADLLTLLIVLRVILSWFRHEAHGLTELLNQVTEPILAPLRRILPTFGVLDLSPLVALIALELLRNFINAYLL